MRVLLIEPWFSGSHRLWAEGYAAGSRHEVSIVSLPSGPWRWRLRAGAVPLAGQIETWVANHGVPDVVLASGLVDVSQLLGLARRSLGSTPVAVYQHESQLVYPTVDGAVDVEAALRNWFSWCAADVVLFNSEHHRAAVVGSLGPFLARQPSQDQAKQLDDVLARFEVLPVGVDLPAGLSRERTGASPVVLWPHRWEPDKDPSGFLGALRKVRSAGLQPSLALAGQEPVVPSAERAAIVEEFGDWIAAAGPFDRDEYLEVLRRSDIVVSCARHEFFGVAVVEAVAAGCVPVLPDALSYPELIEPRWHDVALYEQGRFGSALIDAVARFPERAAACDGLADSMERFSWPVVGSRLDERLAALAGAGG